MKKRTSYILVISIIVVGLVIDLVTKSVLASVLQHGETEIVIIPDFLKLMYMENDGAAYGILGGQTWLLILVTLVFVIGFTLYYIFNHSTSLLYNFGIGFIISGALGNFVDRICLGYVRDFVSFKFFNFVFNLADVFITIGVICFAIFTIKELIRESREAKGKNIGNDTLSDK